MNENLSLDNTLNNYSKYLYEDKLLINVSHDIRSIKNELEKNHKNKKYIENFIRHSFLHKISDNKKSGLGKYYTPDKLVRLIKTMVQPYINENSVIMDLACGCGAFLCGFENHRVIARDIDEIAVNVLKELDYENVAVDNSLSNISRSKYNLTEKDHIVIIGNPPYNDKTSKVKKNGVNAKSELKISIDEGIKSNDLGISFLNCFAKLKSNIVCVLHPLSYLIKESNFNVKMKYFISNYVLKEAVIFSSAEFSDTQKTPFPIGAFLYIRNNYGMNFNYIENFHFKNIYDDDDDFILSNYETIDGYIRKYPPKLNDIDKVSDIGLYMHTIRDLNSLITSGNLTEKEDFKMHITINYKNLYKYSYLNCMRRYFAKDYKFGNLSPLVCSKELENNQYFQDMFIIDTILNNQKLNIFNKENKNSIIWTKNLFNDYKVKMSELQINKLNIYEIFCNFVMNDINQVKKIKEYLINYFSILKETKLNRPKIVNKTLFG